MQGTHGGSRGQPNTAPATHRCLQKNPEAKKNGHRETHTRTRRQDIALLKEFIDHLREMALGSKGMTVSSRDDHILMLLERDRTQVSTFPILKDRGKHDPPMSTGT